MTDENDIAYLEAKFAAIPHLYIADGHHRSAGSAAYAERMQNKNAEAEVQASSKYSSGISLTEPDFKRPSTR